MSDECHSMQIKKNKNYTVYKLFRTTVIASKKRQSPFLDNFSL